MSHKTKALGVLFACLTILAGPATLAGSEGNSIIATWRTETGGHVTISPCGSAFCGRVTKVVVPPSLQEQFSEELAELDGPVPDYLNSDPELRTRPVLNLQVLAMQATSEPNFFEGTLYNPEDGNTYSGRIELLAEDRLRLDGCVLQVLCSSQEWVKVE